MILGEHLDAEMVKSRFFKFYNSYLAPVVVVIIIVIIGPCA